MHDKFVQSILNEKIEYIGIRNFASKGIEVNSDGLMRSFDYGFNVGVECAKKDIIRLLKKYMYKV